MHITHIFMDIQVQILTKLDDETKNSEFFLTILLKILFISRSIYCNSNNTNRRAFRLYIHNYYQYTIHFQNNNFKLFIP